MIYLYGFYGIISHLKRKINVSTNSRFVYRDLGTIIKWLSFIYETRVFRDISLFLFIDLFSVPALRKNASQNGSPHLKLKPP